MSILEVRDVSIRYLTGDFKEIGIKEYVLRKIKRNYNVNEFWADRHVSFSLQKGDMLGIIGTNGAGKSTLLKVISGIMEPTEGFVKREGTIAALLELGSGFDGELTVRENTYLRGAMLGYTRKFMDETYDEIISFAELEEFQDRPFKQLSSGMKSRLAFSIASLVKPDILILDEVLSVGDGAFKAKSEAKMKEILSSGATTILVSHSIQQVREMCNKVLWLHKGEQIAFSNDVNDICDRYEDFIHGNIDAKKRQIGLSQCKDSHARIQNEKVMPGKYPMKYILEEELNAHWLVVTFSSMASLGAKNKKQYSFMNVCEGIRCHRLFLQDSLGERGTYYMVQHMDFSVSDQIISWIETVRKKLNVDKEHVITIGSSKGGTSALYFALKGNYGHSVSMALQTKIGTYVKRINDVSKYMFDEQNIDESIQKLDSVIFNLEKENNDTLIHLYISENDGLYDMHFRPLLEQMQLDRPQEKMDVVVDNRIQSHADHIRFNAEYAVKKLCEIMFGVTIDLSDENSLLIVNSSAMNQVTIELEPFKGIRNKILVTDKRFEKSMRDVKRASVFIHYKDVELFRKQIFSCIGSLVSLSYTQRGNVISVEFTPKEDVKNDLLYALYVGKSDGTYLNTFWYQKEKIIQFEAEKGVSKYSLICFWMYEGERYSKIIDCYPNKIE